MTPQDKLFLAFYFLVVIVFQGLAQAARFRSNKKVNKRLHEVHYLLTATPMIWMYWPMWWQVLLIALMERLAVFDFFLNWVRGKPAFYNGKGTTDSLQDKIENKLSAMWVKVLKVGYVIIFVTVIIILK